VVLGAALELAGVLLRDAVDQDALAAADHLAADVQGILVDALLQDGEALLLHLHRHIVGQVRRRGAGTGAVDKAEAGVETDVGNQVHGRLEIRVAFAGEADDEIGAEGNVRAQFFQAAQLRLVLDGGVAALHHRQDAVGTGLHRQVQVADQLRYLGIDIDQRIGKLHRVTGGVADAVDTVDGADHDDQFRQVGDAAGAIITAVGVDVLAEQVDLAHAEFGQMADFRQYRLNRAAHFLAAGIGHDAEGAVLGAAFHDRDKRARAVDAGFRQAVELLDFREADVDGQALALARLGNQRRQAMQGLRAEDDVDVGRAFTDRLAFLACDAAANTDNELQPLRLELFPAAELVKHLFLRLFTDRAGIQQEDVGFLRVVGLGQTMAG